MYPFCSSPDTEVTDTTTWERRHLRPLSRMFEGAHVDGASDYARITVDVERKQLLCVAVAVHVGDVQRERGVVPGVDADRPIGQVSGVILERKYSGIWKVIEIDIVAAGAIGPRAILVDGAVFHDEEIGADTLVNRDAGVVPHDAVDQIELVTRQSGFVANSSADAGRRVAREGAVHDIGKRVEIECTAVLAR